ncbi:MAG: hypothetical protein NC118_14045 [Eubacterium sp.]|nr:hypothetical protein [Eubacterium sp.]
MDISFDYLQELLQETEDLRVKAEYSDVNENDYDEIVYIANKNNTSIGVQSGLGRELYCKKYNLKEKHTIRKNSQYYCKIYKKDGKIIRVESYVKGRIDVVFIAYYTEDRRFMFPFFSNGRFYPTYTYVTHFHNGIVDEEYQSDRVQIVYERYLYTDDNSIKYEYLNYVPNGTYPVVSRASGIFTLSPELNYTSTQYSTWRDDKTLNSNLPN